MNDQNTVGEWVSEDITRAKMFESLGIDFCCGGHKSLREACREKGLSSEQVIADLHRPQATSREIDCRSMGAHELCDHLEKTHHAYLRRVLPQIAAHLKKIVNAHGEQYALLQETFERLCQEIGDHLAKEETLVFPLFRSNNPKRGILFQELEGEHEEVGRLLETIR